MEGEEQKEIRGGQGRGRPRWREGEGGEREGGTYLSL